MEVVLFDGTYELFRAHFGAPERLDPTGRPIGGACGVLVSLAAFLRRRLEACEVPRLAVAFDHVIRSFRNDMLASYKDGADVAPQLLAQFGLVEALITQLGVPVWSMVEFEADDALATAASVLAKTDGVTRVVIATPDKDLTQCVLGTRVVCWDRRKDVYTDHEGVRARYGAAPESIPDWLALVGDAADGIPGIPGWGPTSTAAVLGTYAKLEAIPADASSWTVRVRGAERLARSLQEHFEEALLYREVATLRRDAPIDGLAALPAWAGANRAGLAALLEPLDALDLLDRIPGCSAP